MAFHWRQQERIKMSMLLIVSTLMLALGIVLMIIGSVRDRSEVGAAGFMLSLTAIILGFGMLGILMTAETTYDEVTQFTFAKTENTVLIEANGLAQTFTDAKTFNAIEKIEKVYIKTDLNSYNGVLQQFVVLEKESE